MRSGEHEIARAYVLYRERRSQERASKTKQEIAEHSLTMLVDGRSVPLDQAWLEGMIADACLGLDDQVSAQQVLADTLKNIYDGVPIDEIEKSAILRRAL